MATVQRVNVKKEDRLFSLILALSASRDGLTKSEIQKSVRGYAERYSHGTDPTLDKLFERDKADLRSMGVVINTFEFAGEEGQTHNVRYAISRDAYVLPEGVTFSPTETALLSLASLAWRDASLSADSRHALNKIRSLGVTGDDSLIGIAPRIRTVDRAFSYLAEALDDEAIVNFLYVKPGAVAPELRSCAPLALSSWRGCWYMLAQDIELSKERTFLLSRIVSEPKRIPQQKFVRPEGDYASRLLNELSELATKNRAELAIDPDSIARGQLIAMGAHATKAGSYVIDYADEALLADDLTPFAKHVRVLSPLSLHELILHRLQSVLHAHEGAM